VLPQEPVSIDVLIPVFEFLLGDGLALAANAFMVTFCREEFSKDIEEVREVKNGKSILKNFEFLMRTIESLSV